MSSCGLHRLFRPWDFPGKNTGVGCHFLLQKTLKPKLKMSEANHLEAVILKVKQSPQTSFHISEYTPEKLLMN